MKENLAILRIYIQSLFILYGWQRDRKTLHCGCAIASYFVFMYLRQIGLAPVFVKNRKHCWVREGGKTIDLTAIQFDGGLDGELYIDRREEENFRFYRGPLEFARTEEEILGLIGDWPSYQNPFYFIKRIKEKGYL